MEPKTNCIICESELSYFTDSRKMVCAVCGKESMTNTCCEAGHFVCDECHAKKGIELCLKVCAETKEKDPQKIILQLMKMPFVHMHGPEHHILVGAALLSAYKNCGGNTDLTRALSEMKARGRQIPGGACGFWGCCGAAVSTGIFISIITGANPMKKKEWQLANLMTSTSLRAIAELGGPRCCKRNSFTAIAEAVKFTQKYLNVKIEYSDRVVCGYSSMNNECIKEKCPYHSN